MSVLSSKKFDFSEVVGISANQLSQHYKLYEKYVDKINEIVEKENKMDVYKNPSTIYSDIRSLKKGESYAMNGVKLHQLYFENLTGKNVEPFGNILNLINEQFGSFEEFKNEFVSVGLAMRGWVVLAIDCEDKKLHIYGLDEHDVGGVWDAKPLIVMDVYEHSYMIDYGIDRKKYIDAFFENIDFVVVNNRHEPCKSQEKSDSNRSLCWGKYY